MHTVLSAPPAASNAAAQPVRTESRTSPPRPALAPITFPAVLNDELFERWLDAYPRRGRELSRRESHERHSDEKKAEERARVARMYTLRCCDAANAFSKALAIAEQLYEAVHDILRLYGPNEAERVLKAAGLPLPGKWDICCGYDGETFKEPHAAAKKLKSGLSAFIDRVNELYYILPDCLEQEHRDEDRAAQGKAI